MTSMPDLTRLAIRIANTVPPGEDTATACRASARRQQLSTLSYAKLLLEVARIQHRLHPDGVEEEHFDPDSRAANPALQDRVRRAFSLFPGFSSRCDLYS